MNEQSQSHSVGAKFWQAVDARPNALAIRDNESLTYTELGVRASTIARHILAYADENVTAHYEADFHQDAPSPAVVALMMEHSASLVTAIVGVTLSGFAYQPVDISFPKDRVRSIFRVSRPKIIVASSEQFDAAQACAPEGSAVYRYDDLVTKDCYAHDDNAERCVAERHPDGAAYVLSTSGSTGTPKLIVHSEKSMYRSVNHYLNDMKVTDADNIALILPCSYTPSVFCIFGALLSGATLDPFDLKTKSVGEMAEWLKQRRVTLLYSSPTIFRRLMNDIKDDTVFSSLRSVQLAGEPLFKSDVEAYQNRFPDSFSLYNGMGTTETNCLTRNFIDSSTQLSESRVPIGEPYEDVKVELRDENGQPTPLGQEGELYVTSEFFATEYLRDTERSALQFSTRQSEHKTYITYRTGDRARVTESGELLHLGRLDDQIKLRGQRVELAEIEATMLRSNLASQAFVTLITEYENEPYIAAFFQPQHDVGELRRYLSQQLPPYMIPTRIVSMSSLPTNSSGKIDRRALNALALSRKSQEGEDLSADAENVVEQRIVECFREVLKNPSLTVNSDFFDSGGDSLRAVELAVAMQRQLAVPINVSCLIEAPTPRALARLAKRILNSGGIKNLVRFHDEEYAAQRSKEATPIFCLPGFAGDALSFRALAAHMLKVRPVYAIEYPGYDGNAITFSTLNDLVELCFSVISQVYPKGDIALVCYSLGGVVGYELTRKFQDNGRNVSLLAMMDCYDPTTIKAHYLRDSAVTKIKTLFNLNKARPGISETIQQTRNKVDSALAKAVYKYKPKSQKVEQVLLIKAIDQHKPLGIFDNYSQWYKLNSNPIRTVTASGAHIDLIMPNKAEEITKIINENLYSEKGNESKNSPEPEQTNNNGANGNLYSSLRDTWGFGDSTFPEITQIDNYDDSPQTILLAQKEQLTNRLSKQVNEEIEPKILTSEQRGRFYYRKVALQTRESKRTAAVAAIRISIDRLPKNIAAEIIEGKQAFGNILSNNDFSYHCTDTTLFQAKTNTSLKRDFLIDDEDEPLLGRTNQFNNTQGAVIADVIEVIAPWV